MDAAAKEEKMLTDQLDKKKDTVMKLQKALLKINEQSTLLRFFHILALSSMYPARRNQ